METTSIDISTFDYDPDYFGSRRLLVTIKSFDLQAIRDRYLASKNNKSGRRGYVERREAGTGGIAFLKLHGDRLESEVLYRMKEPRGVDAKGEKVAIAAKDAVFIFDSGKTYRLRYPWFSYIHTVAFSPQLDNAILVASSGLDCIFEFDYVSGKLLWEWFAWENGFNRSYDAQGNEQYLCRTLDHKRALEAEGKPAKLIKNPTASTLPTAQRAAFINSVAYRNDEVNEILATFFHEGKLFSIDRETGGAKAQVADMKSPHGGKHLAKNSWLVTSTATGEVVELRGDHENRFKFHGLDHKAPEMGEAEWLQNSIVEGDTIITVDSNRNRLVLFDPKARKYAMAAYDSNWAVQDLVSVSFEKDRVRRLQLI